MDVVRQLVALFRIDFDERSLADVDRGVAQARQRATGFVGAMNNAGSAMNGLLWRGAALLASGALGHSIVQRISEFESLEASMQVTLGSASRTAEAMTFVREFAKGSKDSISQIAMAYQMLVAQGVDPTMERMTALGDAAAATGAPVSELVDAIAGGMIGNTERLDVMFGRFGMNFKSQNGVLFAQVGDELQRVGTSFAEISAYVEALGRNRFAGGMALQAATLGGRISMLGDAWGEFVLAMGANGVKDGLKELADALTFAFGGSGRLARVLGGALGRALRAVAITVRYLAEHTDLVGRAFMVLGGVAVVASVARLVAALRSAAIAGTLFSGSMAALPLIVGIAVLATVALIDDLYAYMEGRPSLIGSFIDANQGERGFAGDMARLLSGSIDEITASMERLATWWSTNVPTMNQMADKFRELRAEIEPLVEALRWLDDTARAVTGGRMGMIGAFSHPGAYLDAYLDNALVVAHEGAADTVDANGNPTRRRTTGYTTNPEEATFRNFFAELGVPVDRFSGARGAAGQRAVVTTTNIGDIIVTANTASDAAVIAAAVDTQIRSTLGDWAGAVYDRAQSARK